VTSIYAVVKDPVRIAFAPDGTLYAGRDASGSGAGTGDAVKIHRIAPGGSPVTEFGDLAISDPDALIVDVAGTVSEMPGSVLVGGVHPGGATGKIVRIAPDGTATNLFGPNSGILNPSHFIFDSAGRLVFTENNNGKVMVTTGGAPTNLFSPAGAAYIVEDTAGRLVASSSSDTRLRLYSASGELLSGNFAPAKTGSPLARGPGGLWGTNLYAVAANGDLVSIDLSGATNRVGRGFSNISDLEFGPDNGLYVSDFDNDLVWRIASDAPRLSIVPSNAAVLVSWPAPAEDWLLHAAANFLSDTSGWKEIPPPYAAAGTNLQFTESASAGSKFYRLHKP